VTQAAGKKKSEQNWTTTCLFTYGYGEAKAEFVSALSEK
jgi:hypothetical protein